MHCSPPDSLEPLRQLRFLDLSYNKIRTIGDLSSHPHLQTLILDFNPVQQLDAASFGIFSSVLRMEYLSELVNNRELHTLSLRASSIGNVRQAASALQGVTSLRNLRFQFPVPRPAVCTLVIIAAYHVIGTIDCQTDSLVGSRSGSHSCG